MRVINLNKLIVFATPRTRSQHKKKLRSRNFGADKQYKFDYLFENCSSVKKTVLWTVFSCAAGALLRGPEGEKIPKAISDFGVDNSKYTIISLRTEELYELL